MPDWQCNQTLQPHHDRVSSSNQLLQTLHLFLGQSKAYRSWNKAWIKTEAYLQLQQQQKRSLRWRQLQQQLLRHKAGASCPLHLQDHDDVSVKTV